MSDTFFDVPRTTAMTSAGPVELPILYHEVSHVLALFRGRRRAVEDLLVGTGLQPALGLGGDAVLALACYQYRKTSIGAYNEVGVATFVKPTGWPTPRLAVADLYRPVDARATGAYVIDLPVTTAIANAGGRELWGYPKFVTDISFQLDRTRFECAVADPTGGASIMMLAGRLGLGVPAPPMSVVTFSNRRDELVRTHVNVRGAVRARGGGGLRLVVGASRHPMAERLRRLGLD
ncbi:MAG: acetoacetate decarboxylase family protein, partial [Deltaproteobacteria bacterium]|nr:acetoacetate decarboxylase family protein [Kofleriaceae bacterium]